MTQATHPALVDLLTVARLVMLATGTLPTKAPLAAIPQLVTILLPLGLATENRAATGEIRKFRHISSGLVLVLASL